MASESISCRGIRILRCSLGRALAPSRVSKVLSDPERHVITAIVDEDQLSLAIGRNGQNVRLASQLIGWQIDLVLQSRLVGSWCRNVVSLRWEAMSTR